MLPCSIPTAIPDDRAQPAPARWWSGLATVPLGVLGPLLLWVAAVSAAAMLSSPDVPAGRCEGIGWGCELSPRDGVAVAGIIGGVVIVPAFTVVLGIVVLLRPADRRRQTVVTAVTGFAVILVVLVGAAAVAVAAA